MPAYHSTFNETDCRSLGNMAFLPIKTKVRGPANSFDGPGDEDIIDEAFNLFRANCLFKNYEIKGGADRALIYLTLFISECLVKISKTPSSNLSPGEMLKSLNNIALQSFTIPGDPNFPLNALFSAPTDRHESDLLRQYLSQLRQETVIRLMDRVYQGEQTPSKWWMMFSKRKFMGKAL